MIAAAAGLPVVRLTVVAVLVVVALVLGDGAERDDRGEHVTTTPQRWAGECERPYADSSPWNTPIPDDAATHPDSAVAVAALGERLTSDPTQYTYPLYAVDEDTPLRTVRLSGWFSDVAAGGEDLRHQRGGVVTVPIPDAAAAARGSDRQVVLLDPVTGDEWGFSHFEAVDDGTYEAWNGYHYDVAWSGVPPRAADGSPFFSRGAGVPYLAGLVRQCEIEAGRIDHALAVAAPNPSGEHVYPATKSDGDGVGPASLPEGSRLQLDPTLSEASLRGRGCDGPCLVIARALQEYGMYLVDGSRRPKVIVEYEGTAGWGGAVDAATVSPLPMSSFRVLEPAGDQP